MSVDANDLREALYVFLESPPQAAVQPSPESIQSRSRWLRPTCVKKSKPNMAGTRNPFGRRPHPGSRIHLTCRQPTRQKPPPKEILAQRSGELRSRRLKTAVKSPESAVYRRGMGIFLTETPPPDSTETPLPSPFSPATPISPPSGPIQWLFQGPSAESKLLAVGLPRFRKISLRSVRISEH